MKKLFISQPMNGKTDGQILSEREKAIKIAKEILNESILFTLIFLQMQNLLNILQEAFPIWLKRILLTLQKVGRKQEVVKLNMNVLFNMVLKLSKK